jgi:hypothetical protein
MVVKMQKDNKVILTGEGTPVSELVPEYVPDKPRTPGSMAGQIWIAPDFDTLPADMADTFGMRVSGRD